MAVLIQSGLIAGAVTGARNDTVVSAGGNFFIGTLIMQIADYTTSQFFTGSICQGTPPFAANKVLTSFLYDSRTAAGVLPVLLAPIIAPINAFLPRGTGIFIDIFPVATPGPQPSFFYWIYGDILP